MSAAGACSEAERDLRAVGLAIAHPFSPPLLAILTGLLMFAPGPSVAQHEASFERLEKLQAEVVDRY